MARTHIPIVAIKSDSMLEINIGLSISVWVDGKYGSKDKIKTKQAMQL